MHALDNQVAVLQTLKEISEKSGQGGNLNAFPKGSHKPSTGCEISE